MRLPPDFQFSQSSLQDYLECPRRFELKYIQRLRWPAPITQPQREHEQHMRAGAMFHQMIHQHTAGVPSTAITGMINADNVKQWWGQYLISPYNTALTDTTPLPKHRLPEIALSVPIAGYRLIAKFDLLAIEPNGPAVIVDWKTGTRRPTSSHLAQRMQTLVYRYLLVEAGTHFNGGQPIDPANVEMVYWFTADPENPEHIRYSVDEHAEVGHHLTTLIDEIATRETFDLTTETRRCRFCAFRSLCERGIEAGTLAEMDALADDFNDDSFELDFDFDQVAEVEF